VNVPVPHRHPSRHIAWVIAGACKHGAAEVEATVDAEDAWVHTVVSALQRHAGDRESCTPATTTANSARKGANSNQDELLLRIPTEYTDIHWPRGGPAHTRRARRPVVSAGRANGVNPGFPAARTIAPWAAGVSPPVIPEFP